MKVLLFVTGCRHVKEYDYFNRFLQRLNTLSDICDLFIHCNNSDISEKILTYYKQFKQKNKFLYVTSLNIGHAMGGVEALSTGIDMGIFNAYDYVIHLDPDVYITDETRIIEVLRDNLENDCVFFMNKSYPDDERFFSFDFFIFKPRLLKSNIFKEGLYSGGEIVEHHVCDAILRNKVKFKLIKRFEDDNWFPRRVDEHLKLYHEHDLKLVEELFNALAKCEKKGGTSPGANGQSGAAVPRWEPPVVELRPRFHPWSLEWRDSQGLR